MRSTLAAWLGRSGRLRVAYLGEQRSDGVCIVATTQHLQHAHVLAHQRRVHAGVRRCLTVKLVGERSGKRLELRPTPVEIQGVEGVTVRTHLPTYQSRDGLRVPNLNTDFARLALHGLHAARRFTGS